MCPLIPHFWEFLLVFYIYLWVAPKCSVWLLSEIILSKNIGRLQLDYLGTEGPTLWKVELVSMISIGLSHVIRIVISSRTETKMAITKYNNQQKELLFQQVSWCLCNCIYVSIHFAKMLLLGLCVDAHVSYDSQCLWHYIATKLKVSESYSSCILEGLSMHLMNPWNHHPAIK